MGNCQAVDAAALVIQHPNGKMERMYWSVTVSEVMKMNPGHYVSLIIPLPISSGEQENCDDNKTIRFTRVKLLRQSDILVLGRAYRLVTTQEVMKVLRAKKHAKLKKKESELGEKLLVNSEKKSTSCKPDAEKPSSEKGNYQVIFWHWTSFSSLLLTGTGRGQDQQIRQREGPNYGGHLCKAFLNPEAAGGGPWKMVIEFLGHHQLQNLELEKNSSNNSFV